MERGAATGRGDAAARIAAIDWLKALAIVAVAVNHAGPHIWSSGLGPGELFVRRDLATFHVPVFLLVSGFLYFRAAPQSVGDVARRLRRFLIPYLLASGVALAGGFSQWDTAGDALRHLALGSALGTYYFFFLLTICVVSIWPLSRIGPVGAAALLGALCAYAVASTLAPSLAVEESFFWYLRNPLHFGGFFLCGWLAAAWRPSKALGRRLRVALGVLGLALGSACLARALPPLLHPLLRAGYTLSVVAVVVSLTSGRRTTPPVVRVLSDATLTIFLYHHMFELSLLPLALPPLLRVPLLAAAGIAGAIGLRFVARTVLGERTRWLLGS